MNSLKKLENHTNAISALEDRISSVKAGIRQIIEPVIEEMGIGSIKRDSIDYIEIGSKAVLVHTVWSARGCENSSDYRIPREILESDDPVAAAKQWKVSKEAEKKQKEKEAAIAEIARLQDKLNQN